MSIIHPSQTLAPQALSAQRPPSTKHRRLPPIVSGKSGEAVAVGLVGGLARDFGNRKTGHITPLGWGQVGA